MRKRLPDVSEMSKKQFLALNLTAILAFPFMVVLAAAGLYIIGIIVGIILLIALMIYMFFVLGPFAIIVDIIVILIFGVSALNFVEQASAFLAFAIPGLVVIMLGIRCIKSGFIFDTTLMKVLGIITGLCYFVSAGLLFVEAWKAAGSSHVNGIGLEDGAAILLPSIARIFYTIAGGRELE